MRTLFITRKFPPSVGGMETYSKCLFDALEEIDPEVDLFKPKHDLDRRPSLWQITSFFFSACWTLFRKRRHYDAVLLGDYAIASLAFAAKAVSFGRIRTVVSLHGNDLYFMRSSSTTARLYRGISQLVVAGGVLDAAVANSQAIRAEAVLHRISPVFVIPLATQLPIMTVTERHLQKEPQLLFTGRLIKYKGLAWFVNEVWPYLDQRYELLVAGQIWDESEHTVLLNKPRVRYIGTVAYPDLPALRSTAMACIMPNIPPEPTEQDEGFGLVALEAPAVGTPIVASACGGIPDAVAHGITGFLLPPLDTAAWVRCLNDVIEWPESQRLSFAEHAKEHIAKHYNWQLVAERTLQVLSGESKIEDFSR